MLDPFGRIIDVIRVSVTDKCTYRCIYCMPVEGVSPIPHEKILRFEEITEIIRVAIELGINKIRLTGGEPLVRRGIINLVEMLAGLAGIADLAMTTNGALLAPVAKDLKAAGLQRINISLDTIDPDQFRLITRGGELKDVLAGIDAALEAGLHPVKINIVTPDETNDADARGIEAYCLSKGLISRRIRQMDIRRGQFSIVQNSDRGDCPKCSRIRLTCDGFIRPCLLSDQILDVRKLGPREAIVQAVSAKPEKGCHISYEFMNRIGG